MTGGEGAGESLGALGIALIGAVMVLSIVLRRGLERFHLPAMAGFIVLGLALSAADRSFGFLTPAMREDFDLLSRLGLVVLLFKVGLESDLGLLLRQLRNAAIVWVPDVGVSTALAGGVMALVAGYDLLAALYAAVAFSATSIGVSTAVWEQAGRLRTSEASLLLDVAELDDVSAVVLMSLLFAVAPLLGQSADGGLWSQVAVTIGWQLALLVAFCLGCLGFSRYAEVRLTGWFKKLDESLGPVVFATGTALLIAAVADMLGFSLAIGALFAGLAFSRDPVEGEIDHAFSHIFALLSPFFFVGIGLAVDISVLGGAFGLGALLLLVAVLGKLLGAGVSAGLLTSHRAGLLIGFSMIPRAEIFLIVMLHGVTMQPQAVPQPLYAAAVFTSLATCILGPLAVQWLMRRETAGEGAA
jgi:Kef-type K+ transport system membrane component KefB